jgi:hypothetical protein
MVAPDDVRLGGEEQQRLAGRPGGGRRLAPGAGSGRASIA